MKVEAIKAGGFIYGQVRKVGEQFDLVEVNGRKPGDQFSSKWMKEVKKPGRKPAVKKTTKKAE